MFSVGTLLNGILSSTGQPGNDEGGGGLSAGNVINTVASLFGPNYDPTKGGEIRRQWPNPDLGQKSYMGWLSMYDPIKWNSGRVWDSQDGSSHTIHWWWSDVWGKKVTPAQWTSGGIPVFDANLNYLGNDTGNGVIVPVPMGAGGTMADKVKAVKTDYPVLFWGAVALVVSLVVWGVVALFGRKPYQPERKR